MGHLVGYAVNITSCVYIAVFVVIFCFPYSLPVNPASMNYACLITGAITIVSVVWWFVAGKTYVGPKAIVEEIDCPMVITQPEYVPKA